jgi:2-haloacid dehalogenase
MTAVNWGTAAGNRMGVKALAFDVSGTVVDWRGSIIREGREWRKAKGLQVDWGKFADRWREDYMPMMDEVRKGTLPWMKLDALHRMILDELLVEFKIGGLSEEEKEDWNHVWHRLKPWPDAVRGLERMKKNYVLATLSNSNVSLLVEMAENAGLLVGCAEISGANGYSYLNATVGSTRMARRAGTFLLPPYSDRLR